VEKCAERATRKSGPGVRRKAGEPDEPRSPKERAVTVPPGETPHLVALSEGAATVPLPDWLRDRPLALLIVIRTVNTVLLNGATLRGNPDRCANPVPRARIPQPHPNRDRDAGLAKDRCRT
jgi:hypothetical protein